MEIIKEYIHVFLISMTPISELRGAIPYGLLNDLNPIVVYIVAVVGNMIPVPLIILLLRPLLNWMKKKGDFKIIEHFEKRTMKKAEKVMKYSALGLFLLVAIPLPGTGAWTGSCVAALLDMRFKYALPSIILGVMTAGIIMMLIQGIISIF